MSTVRFERGNPPPLTEAEQKALREHGPITDDKIDYSDIPQLDDDFWDNAVRGQFYRPVKKQLSLRIDADVIAWLKEGGPGWQTRLNAYLRREMIRDLRRAAQGPVTSQPAPADQKEPAASDA